MTNSENKIGSMALFCDFENIAIGVRDANYEAFDIRLVLEKLLVKGGIIVKKAYCDWSRYRDFKAMMHEAAFELIDIPHVRQSGKNSADIRLVVDALDLCYTKPHVDTFVIISGDSDFSPLVSKLRENNKTVIGVGVKNSASDLLISNCDEFLYYDDMVRVRGRMRATQAVKAARPAPKASAGKAAKPAPAEAGAVNDEERKQKAFDLVIRTLDEVIAERGGQGAVWGSMIKQTLKRRQPGFNESYYGFRSFSRLLEEARDRGFLSLRADEKSGYEVTRNAAED